MPSRGDATRCFNRIDRRAPLAAPEYHHSAAQVAAHMPSHPWKHYNQRRRYLQAIYCTDNEFDLVQTLDRIAGPR